MDEILKNHKVIEVPEEHKVLEVPEDQKVLEVQEAHAEPEEPYLDSKNPEVEKTINDLNEKIQKYCQECKLSITQEVGQDIKNIVHYGSTTTTDLPLLCFYFRETCVSSMLLSMGYQQQISYVSQTQENLRNKKLNTLLRAVLFIIAKKMNDTIEKLEVTISNPISAYLLVKNFDAELWGYYSATELANLDKVPDEDEDEDEYRYDRDYEDYDYQKFPDLKEVISQDNGYNKFIERIQIYSGLTKTLTCIINIDDETIKQATQLFDTTIQQLNLKGGKKTRKYKKRNTLKRKSQSRRKKLKNNDSYKKNTKAK